MLRTIVNIFLACFNTKNCSTLVRFTFCQVNREPNGNLTSNVRFFAYKRRIESGEFAHKWRTSPERPFELLHDFYHQVSGMKHSGNSWSAYRISVFILRNGNRRKMKPKEMDTLTNAPASKPSHIKWVQQSGTIYWYDRPIDEFIAQIAPAHATDSSYFFSTFVGPFGFFFLRLTKWLTGENRQFCYFCECKKSIEERKRERGSGSGKNNWFWMTVEISSEKLH